jgi:uncharacterized protein (DUF983 family)
MKDECPHCHKIVEQTITKLVSRCTACNKDYYSSEQTRAIAAWREFGKQLSKKT